MTTFVVIASAKGGVGKTTTALNLGHALNQFGREVVVVDANFQTPHLTLLLGSTEVSDTLVDALKGEKKITDVAYIHPSGLRIIPSTMSRERLHEAKHEHLADTLLGLQDKVEVVIIDSGPGFTDEFLSTIKIADHVVVVTSPELHAVTDALKTIKIVHDNGVSVLGAVVNGHIDDKYHMTPRNVETLLETPVIGVIPYDDAIRRSHYYKHPVTYSHPLSPSSVAFKKVAAALIGEKYEVQLSSNKKNSFFEQVMQKLGFKGKTKNKQ